MGNFGSKPSSTRMPGKHKKRQSGGAGGGRRRSGSKDKIQSRPLPIPLPKQRDREKEALDELRNTFNKDLKTFILDNLLLSVQFFQNFDREMGALRSTPQTEPEANRNKQLKDEYRHCITPDRVHQLVARRVQFKPQHGENKYICDSLQPQRLVVVQDNVQLMEGRDSGHYSDNTYTLSMEPASSPGYVKLFTNKVPTKRRVTYETIDGKSDESSDESVKATEEDEGIEVSRNHERPPYPLPDFVEQLHKRVEDSGSVDGDVDTTSEVETPRPRLVFGPRSPDREGTSTRPMTLYTKTERKLSGIRRAYPTRRPVVIPPRVQLIPPQQQQQRHLSTSLPNLVRVSPANSESSGYKSSSSLNMSQPNSRGSELDYGYGMITELRTPRPIGTRRLGKTPARSSEIPGECFNKREIPQHDSDSESDDEDRAKPRTQPQLFTTRYYLNSTDYMASFADVFMDRLFEPLGFSEDNTQSPMMQGATIHCDVVIQRGDGLMSRTKMNVMPSIACRSWPEDGLEWVMRARKIVRRHNILYQWPTKKMIDKIQRFGYNILPVGYLPTKGQNTEHQLEWQLAFPQAEAHLESCLTHQQLRCYLFTMALYKSFLEPAQKSELGLKPAHLRTVLFWQCERNYADWPELKPGVTLSKFLDTVYRTLTREKLADYFLPQRNLYESIPLSYLRRVQEQLHRIQENIIMHVLIAVRNLRYTAEPEDFYPRLDYDKLYQIITTEDFVSMLNPSLGLANKEDKVANSARKKKDKKEQPDPSDVNDLWKSAAINDRNRKWNKMVRRQIEAEKAAQQLTQSGPRTSVESIKLEVMPSLGADPVRRKMLLELFIPHFIAIGRQSITHGCYQQSLAYLAHAERLNQLLREEPTADGTVVRDFMLEIRVHKEKATTLLKPPPDEPTTFVFVETPKVTVPYITIADVHSPVAETDTDNLQPSAHVSDEEEVEDTSL